MSFGDAALRLYALAARILLWRPAEFWASTPSELAAALAPPEGAATMDRAALDLLMEHEDGR